MPDHINESQQEPFHLNNIQAAETPSLIKDEDLNPEGTLLKPNKNKKRRMIMILLGALMLIVTGVVGVFLFLSGEDSIKRTSLTPTFITPSIKYGLEQISTTKNIIDHKGTDVIIKASSSPDKGNGRYIMQTTMYTKLSSILIGELTTKEHNEVGSPVRLETRLVPRIDRVPTTIHTTTTASTSTITSETFVSQGNCDYGSWEQWSSCSKSCDEGQQIRKRQNFNHISHEKFSCNWKEALQTRSCKSKKCKKKGCCFLGICGPCILKIVNTPIEIG